MKGGPPSEATVDSGDTLICSFSYYLTYLFVVQVTYFVVDKSGNGRGVSLSSMGKEGGKNDGRTAVTASKIVAHSLTSMYSFIPLSYHKSMNLSRIMWYLTMVISSCSSFLSITRSYDGLAD